MYSFDTVDTAYKYESIQHGYEVIGYDEEEEREDDFFTEISEEEFDEEFIL